jgi:hypothetical protein
VLHCVRVRACSVSPAPQLRTRPSVHQQQCHALYRCADPHWRPRRRGLSLRPRSAEPSIITTWIEIAGDERAQVAKRAARRVRRSPPAIGRDRPGGPRSRVALGAHPENAWSGGRDASAATRHGRVRPLGSPSPRVRRSSLIIARNHSSGLCSFLLRCPSNEARN